MSKGEQLVHVGIHPSKVIITRQKLNKDLKKICERKAKSHQVRKDKGQIQGSSNWEDTYEMEYSYI